MALVGYRVRMKVRLVATDWRWTDGVAKYPKIGTLGETRAFAEGRYLVKFVGKSGLISVKSDLVERVFPDDAKPER